MSSKLIACMCALVSLVGCGSPSASSSLQQTGSTAPIYIALSDHQTSGDADVYRLMAATTNTIDAASVVFCMATVSACNADSTLTRIAGVAKTIDGVNVYLSKNPVKVSEGLSVTLFAKDSAGQVLTQSIKISAN